MEQINLSAKNRTITGKKVKNLRKLGLLPAVLYGQGQKSINLQINLKQFEKTYNNAGTSALVDLKIDDQKPIKVLFNEPQVDPVTNTSIHLDIYKIRMDKKINTEIPLNFVGVAPAVKELEGNLIKSKDSLEIECLPGNLISSINVDISALKTFDDVISIKDLKIPDGIKVLADSEETIASVTPPRSEEELKEMEQVAAVDVEKAQVEKIETEAAVEKEEKEVEKEGEDSKTEKPAESGKKEEKK